MKQVQSCVFSCICMAMIMFHPSLSAGWMEFLEEVVQTTQQGKSQGSAALPLTQEEVVAGLKEAILVGFKRAAAVLGKDGGFLNDIQVKIPMPPGLDQVEKALRAVKQDALADQFVATMNHAAEKSMPAAIDIFTDAIKKMTLKDAHAILKGSDDAATQYFRNTSSEALMKSMRPIITNSTAEVGLTGAYKTLTDQLKKQVGFLAALIDKNSIDLDGYITQKALDGLFLKLAEEEKRIRQNPMARGTELLQKVFGSIQ